MTAVIKIPLLLLAASSLPISLSAQEKIGASVSNRNPRQGETVIITFSNAELPVESATFDGKAVPVFRYRSYHRALFGIPASKPAGSYVFLLNLSDGRFFETTINVRNRKFPLVTLGIPEKLNTTPKALSNQLQTNQKNLADSVAVFTPEIFFTGPFGLPLNDNRKVSSPFGEMRKTGAEIIRHLGIDFDALLDAKVAAINSGRVSRAYLDPIYGKSVLIDHGQTIYSLYLHLNKILVQEGAVVKKGAVIGTVGETGYALAPHLHLSVKIAGVSVDPLQFTRVFK